MLNSNEYMNVNLNRGQNFKLNKNDNEILKASLYGYIKSSSLPELFDRLLGLSENINGYSGKQNYAEHVISFIPSGIYINDKYLNNNNNIYIKYEFIMFMIIIYDINIVETPIGPARNNDVIIKINCNLLDENYNYKPTSDLEKEW